MNRVKQLFLVAFFCQLSSVLKAQVPATWTVNPSDYQYQMTMTCKANEACINLVDTNNYLAAFVGNQCRGIVKIKTSAGTNTLALINIKSNVVSGEKLNFKVFKNSNNTVLTILDSAIFVQGTQIGTLGNPFMLYTNHAPTDIAISTFTVNENSVLGTTAASLSAIDQDAGTVFNYSLTGAQPENTQFAISGNNLTVNSLFNYETDSIKVIEIKVDDNGGCSYVETFTVHVLNANDAPTALTFTSPTISDNQQPGNYMGQFHTLDPEINDGHVYTLVTGLGDTDNGQFYVQNDTLYNGSQIDFITQSIYFIRARSTDLGGLYVENTFTVNVSNLNDAPTSILLSNYFINENMPIASPIGTLSVLDADLPMDSHTLTLVSGTGAIDNALVAIVGNTLQTNASYNYELKDSLFIRIQAKDILGSTYVKTFTIVVSDINDEPKNILISDSTIVESLPLGTNVGSLTTTDEDIASTHTYSLVTGLGDMDNALFTLSANQLKSNSVFNYSGQTYSIRIQTIDNGGLTFEKVFGIKILNLNEAPTDIIIDTLSLIEDNEFNYYISKIRSVDIDNPDAYTYSFVSGTGDTDNAEFTIVNGNLYINNKTNYDVKDLYTIRLKSTDVGGLSVEKAFEVAVIDVVGNSIPLPSTNFISSNGDGKNDFWKVINVEIYKDFELKIFDQFGQVIYNVPNNYNNEFDGKLNGTALPTGNYYYIFKNNKKQYQGNITIVN